MLFSHFLRHDVFQGPYKDDVDGIASQRSWVSIREHLGAYIRTETRLNAD